MNFCIDILFGQASHTRERCNRTEHAILTCTRSTLYAKNNIIMTNIICIIVPIPHPSRLTLHEVQRKKLEPSKLRDFYRGVSLFSLTTTNIDLRARTTLTHVLFMLLSKTSCLIYRVLHKKFTILIFLRAQSVFSRITLPYLCVDLEHYVIY